MYGLNGMVFDSINNLLKQYIYIYIELKKLSLTGDQRDDDGNIYNLTQLHFFWKKKLLFPSPTC